MPSYHLYLPCPFTNGNTGVQWDQIKHRTEAHSAGLQPSLWTPRRTPFPFKCGIRPNHNVNSVNEHQQASIGNN